MKNKKRMIWRMLLFFLIIVTGILAINYWMMSVMEDKPAGPYFSSDSAAQAKNINTWIASYRIDNPRIFTEDHADSDLLDEVWIEKNRNEADKHPETAGYKSILTIYFSSTTKNDLHKFRILPDSKSKLNELIQVEYPDKTPRIRFLLNNVPDTISIEVLERNPADSLAWLTEKVIDTLIFTKIK